MYVTTQPAAFAKSRSWGFLPSNLASQRQYSAIPPLFPNCATPYTSSPTEKFLTLGWTSSTTPATSQPTYLPSDILGILKSIGLSDAALTLRRTVPLVGTGTGSLLENTMSQAPRRIAQRIVFDIPQMKPNLSVPPLTASLPTFGTLYISLVARPCA